MTGAEVPVNVLLVSSRIVAGDKAFVDYSGKKARIVDPTTGEVIEVELFVAARAASNLTYAEAFTRSVAPTGSPATCGPSSISAACRQYWRRTS